VPNYKRWQDIPQPEWTFLTDAVNTFDQNSGLMLILSNAQILQMANAGVMDAVDFGEWVFNNMKGMTTQLAQVPWAEFGLNKDSYEQLATTYSTVYEKITGQQISAQALQQAFLTPNLAEGGLFSGSQYEQQLMNDAAIQKAFGWVKYGMNFAQWTQQKLELRTAFGRDVKDSEAATILQYDHASQGQNVAAIARQAGQGQAPVGVGQSVVR
jgi:hypothetical protein